MLGGCEGYAQTFPDLQFTYLSVRDGLSNNRVTALAQDADGFMWFGTDDGLNRFDGYRIKTFFHTNGDEHSLVNNSVSRIMADPKGPLWISTAEGLSYYDKRTGVFRDLRHDPGDTGGIPNDQYVNFFGNREKGTFLISEGGVYHADSAFHLIRVSTGFKPYTLDNKQIISFGNIWKDRNGHLWASSYNNFYRLDEQTMQIRQQLGPWSGNIDAFYEDKAGNYWIGAFLGGLRRFDPATGTAKEITLNSPTGVINSITEWEDPHHTRWIVIGSDQGIILLDPVTLQSKEYSFHPGYLGQHYLSGNNVFQVFVDRQNILWVATDGGVCYVEPSRQLFELRNIYTPQELLERPDADYIYSCAETGTGYWASRWIVQGLFHYSKTGELVEKITTAREDGHVIRLKDERQLSYIMSRGDSLWFTSASRLTQYDPRTGNCISYSTPDTLNGHGLRTIIPIDERHWWIRTRNNAVYGIYVFDPVARRFTKHYIDTPGCTGCAPPYLLDILQTKKKDIYLTSRIGGLFKFDPVTEKFNLVFKFEGKDGLKRSNTFESLAEDDHGILWIATMTGLFSYDPVSGKVIKDYLSNPLFGTIDINRVFIDEQQNIWMNTRRGIFCILHSNGQIRQIGIAEGLPNNYTDGILQTASDHYIYSGISGFIVRIRPEDLRYFVHSDAGVHFSEATVMDIPYHFRFNTGGRKEMTLEPGENRFALDFSVMNYDITENNRYYYLLDGVMTDWQHNENGHLAFYNLSPGSYTLHVKGGDKLGGMFRYEDEVRVIVKPWWWQTAWFKGVCALLAVSLAVFFIRRRIRLIRREALIKQKMAETEMMALRSQMNPHFIFNSLNSIENFMMKNEKRLASSYLNKFARLVRMILDSSRNELVPIIRDMEALQLYVDLEQLRFNNKFSFRLDLDPILRDSDHRVPSLLIQPYVENAIVHGLAHSEREDLRLTVASWLDGEYVNYTIEDNGVGRQLSAAYNRQNKPHHKSVGLKITEDRINIFNQQQGAKGHISIVDLFDQYGLATGTRVEIKIKAA